MALPTFMPDPKPSPGGSRKPTLKILEAEFGDGYSQPTPNGINHIRKNYSASWGGLTLAQMQAIEAFFVGLGGTQAFYYQPYGEAAPLKWTCQDWSSNDTGGIFKMTAEFKQSFTAAV